VYFTGGDEMPPRRNTMTVSAAIAQLRFDGIITWARYDEEGAMVEVEASYVGDQADQATRDRWEAVEKALGAAGLKHIDSELTERGEVLEYAK
jgi:hypothetical protein